ncbi:hypothetical protein BK128_17490 [Viridibacillus sp. FSL H7-0596]|uniref:aminoglycoside 6-adenylyltransferase n=1 Tax=unclassified Viridibacillus TaxID=2617942 RepID=UPI00096EB0DD|nr:aminoglycoside 6-adenylyltransferase [Viridibacillus sp. FSL H7-0596]OMC84364.1 hypothetical protein BK128_17490 [Viridibacillus sp. FSL H7-0596]
MLFHKIINELKSSYLIEGIVQLGSGVKGYKDKYSDIDLMVSTKKIGDIETTKKFIYSCFSALNSIYIKELKFREDIYLLIIFLENGLEFNVSILPTEYLNVKSPLWNVIFDKTGLVTKKMDLENERFTEKRVKYQVNEDIGFEFVYTMRKFYTELNRHNLIYSLKMLETMRDYILQVQALNENKKLHQFKAYETLHPEFITIYLNTYPTEITVEELLISANKLKGLFYETIKQNNIFSMDKTLFKLLNMSNEIVN